MIFRFRLFLSAGLLLLAAVALPAQTSPPNAAPKRVDFQKTFPVAAGSKVEIDLSTHAGLTVTAWERNEVSVQVAMSGYALIVEARQESGNVLVQSRYETVTHPIPTEGTIRIQVPRGIQVKAQLAGGQVALEGLAGETSLETQQGDITGTDLGGKAYLTTLDGQVKLTGGKLDSYVTAQGGSVSFHQVRGKLGGAGAAGHFLVDSPNQPVDARIAPGLLALLVTEGDVEASTSGALLELTWKGPKLTRQRNFRLSAHYGTMVLNLPEGLGLETFVEQVRQEEPAGNPGGKAKGRKKLQSDFYLGEAPDEKTFAHQGRKHHLTRVEKQVNGGGNRLEIRAVEADIQLKEIE